MTEIKEKVIQFLIETWKKSYLDDNLLFLKTVMKKNWCFKKMFGLSAKYLANNNCAAHTYTQYSLWKTQKITPDIMKICSIQDFSTKTVQTAEKTYLSKLMLNFILEPVSVRYCKIVIIEYCKDSKSYLEDLEARKTSFFGKKTAF